MADKMSKVERLAVAGAVAPFLREGHEEASSRRVGRLDKDGNCVGYTTWAEVQRAQFARHSIEIDVQPDERPKEFLCGRCGLTDAVPPKGPIPNNCRRCLKYSKAIGRKTREALDSKRSRGEWLGGGVPYGYALDADGVSLVSNEAEARNVALMQELKGRGLSYRRVCDELERQGVCARNGKKFHPTQIKRLIDPEKYGTDGQRRALDEARRG